MKRKVERTPEMNLIIAEAAVAAARFRLEHAVEQLVVAETRLAEHLLVAAVGRAKP